MDLMPQIQMLAYYYSGPSFYPFALIPKSIVSRLGSLRLRNDDFFFFLLPLFLPVSPSARSCISGAQDICVLILDIEFCVHLIYHSLAAFPHHFFSLSLLSFSPQPPVERGCQALLEREDENESNLSAEATLSGIFK